MKYEQFIEELESLREKGKALIEQTSSHENPEFRAWRHELTDLFSTIKDEGYTVNSVVENRQFNSVYSVYEPKEKNIAYYKQALTDTLNEIDTILKKYKKYGVPSKISEGIKGEVPYPSRVTWNWLKSHIPFNWWVKAGAILITVFLFGVSVGQSKLYKQLFVSGGEVEVSGQTKDKLPNKAN